MAKEGAGECHLLAFETKTSNGHFAVMQRGSYLEVRNHSFQYKFGFVPYRNLCCP